MLLCRICRLRPASGEAMCNVWRNPELCGYCHHLPEKKQQRLGKRYIVEIPEWPLQAKFMALARLEVGVELERRRRSLGWTQREAGRRAGTGAACVSRAERGEHLEAPTLDAIARALFSQHRCLETPQGPQGAP